MCKPLTRKQRHAVKHETGALDRRSRSCNPMGANDDPATERTEGRVPYIPPGQYVVVKHEKLTDMERAALVQDQAYLRVHCTRNGGWLLQNIKTGRCPGKGPVRAESGEWVIPPGGLSYMRVHKSKLKLCSAPPTAEEVERMDPNPFDVYLGSTEGPSRFTLNLRGVGRNHKKDMVGLLRKRLKKHGEKASELDEKALKGRCAYTGVKLEGGLDALEADHCVPVHVAEEAVHREFGLLVDRYREAWHQPIREAIRGLAKMLNSEENCVFIHGAYNKVRLLCRPMC